FTVLQTPVRTLTAIQLRAFVTSQPCKIFTARSKPIRTLVALRTLPLHFKRLQDTPNTKALPRATAANFRKPRATNSQKQSSIRTNEPFHTTTANQPTQTTEQHGRPLPFVHGTPTRHSPLLDQASRRKQTKEQDRLHLQVAAR